MQKLSLQKISDNKSNHKLNLFIQGIIYAVLASLISYFIFKPFASIAAVFITALACTPYVLSVIKKEDDEVEENLSERAFMIENWHFIIGLVWLFIGIVVGFLIISFSVPDAMRSTIFQYQINAITAVNAHATQTDTFIKLIASNLVVVGISLALSLVFCVGSVAIISWNASLVAIALSQFIVINAPNATPFGALLLGVVRYFIHSAAEFAAFMLAGLAGGLIYIAIANHEFGTQKWKDVMMDAGRLVLYSIFFIILGAFIEVFVTKII